MAQTGYNTIQLYYSTTAAAVPSAGNLAFGELAINITDGKLFYKDNLGVVQEISGGGGGGVTSFSAGTTGLTPNTATTGAVTLAGTLGASNGGTGQTTYTDGQLLIGNSTGNTLTKATLTAGTGISITNGAGSITIASSGGDAGRLLNTQYFTTPTMTVTISIASPAVITFATGSVPQDGSQVVFTTTGALPTGITASTVYYVINAGTSTCNISATVGGSAINTSGTQSGTHTAQAGNYTPTSGTNFIEVEVIGGGGGTTGAGGTSSFGSVCSATGGGQASGTMAVGGSGTSGDINSTGQRGAAAFFSTNSIGTQTNYAQGGLSGYMGFGKGASNDATASGTGGTNTATSGAGGGYAKKKVTSSFSGTTITVGRGGTSSSPVEHSSSGIVVIYEYS
jgi:hypothetical protein